MRTIYRSSVCLVFLLVSVLIFNVSTEAYSQGYQQEYGLWASRTPNLDRDIWDPCDILYTISEYPHQKYSNDPDYQLVGLSTSWEELEAIQRYFSKFYDDQPDDIVKLYPCYDDTPVLYVPNNVTVPPVGGLWGNLGGGVPPYQPGIGVYAYRIIEQTPYWPDGLGWHPCYVKYVWTERPGYDDYPDYVLIATVDTENEARALLESYSMHWNDNPDNVVKFLPCWKVKFAVEYATTAEQQVAAAMARCQGCGAPNWEQRWTPYYENHFGWAIDQLRNNSYERAVELLDYETDARRRCLEECPQ